MNIKSTHLLIKHGLLKVFSITKKVNVEKIINKIVKKSNQDNNAKVDINKEIVNALNKEIEKDAKDGKIPGFVILVPDEDKNTFERVKKFIDYSDLKFLIELSDEISFFVNNKKINKFVRCFFIHLLVSKLNLTQEDFDEFNKYNENNDN